MTISCILRAAAKRGYANAYNVLKSKPLAVPDSPRQRVAYSAEDAARIFRSPQFSPSARSKAKALSIT
jgi:hypothetical protein